MPIVRHLDLVISEDPETKTRLSILRQQSRDDASVPEPEKEFIETLVQALLADGTVAITERLIDRFHESDTPRGFLAANLSNAVMEVMAANAGQPRPQGVSI